LKNFINRERKFAILFGDDIARIVRTEFQFHVVVHIEPCRMVIHLLSDEGHPRHEGKCLLKIFESKLSDELIVNLFPHMFNANARQTYEEAREKRNLSSPQPNYMIRKFQ